MQRIVISRLKFALANFSHPLRKGVVTPRQRKGLIGVAIVKLMFRLIVTAMTVFLFACGFDFDFIPDSAAANVSEAVFDVSSGFIPFDEPEVEIEVKSHIVFIRYDEYILSMYEPPHGSYLGAFIEEDRLLAGDIGMFERMSGVNHAIYSYKYTLGNSFPVRFILQSLARSKTPLVEIRLPVPEDMYYQTNGEHYNFYELYELIKDLAKAFGEFNVPMFISFNASESGFDRDMNKEFYIMLRKAFTEHAPKCAFVWGINMESVGYMFDYYPGDEWVDWVGINAFSNITPEGGHSDIFEKLDIFYFAFQKRKPIMITGLGVSNFSTIDHSYRVAEASLVMNDIYERISIRYPRIKAVIYSGHTRNFGRILQSYQLTDSERMLAAYRDSTQSEWFISDIDTKSNGENISQWILSRHIAKVVDGNIFILNKSFEDDFGIPLIELNSHLEYLEIFDDKQFFNSRVLNNFGVQRVVIDESSKRVFISNS